MAYQTLMVREARRCGGKGWLAYDSYFRQQAVGDDKADWSRSINQSLYTPVAAAFCVWRATMWRNSAKTVKGKNTQNINKKCITVADRHFVKSCSVTAAMFL